MRRPRTLRACVLLGLGSLPLMAGALALWDRQAPTPVAVTAPAVAVSAPPAVGGGAIDATDTDALEERLLMVREAASRRRTEAAAERVRVWPAAGARTGWFGERRRSHSHPGMDLDGETGDPIWAAAAGTVIHAGQAPSGYGGYGIMVLIDHGGGVQTLYAHLSRLTVAVGHDVAAGEVVGAMGTTGNVTGSHLHFEVRIDGLPTDPQAWLPPRRP